LKSAQNAASSQARLVHYDLAGRYSLKVVAAEALADTLPPPICSSRLDVATRDIEDA
jgi:hypothetical protein